MDMDMDLDGGMDLDGVVLGSHSLGGGSEGMGSEKNSLKRKQFDAPLVRCTGVLLDETKLDCSVDRGTSSNLEIGQGQLVINEGDEGIKSILNANPPNATLQIGVECLSWSSAGAEESCKDGSMLKDETTDKEICKENLKELAKFEASPEDGTSLLSKSERLDFSVNDGKFFEAAKKMKKGQVVVLTAKSQDSVPQSASNGEGSMASTLELVSWKTFAEAADDNKVLNNDAIIEEEEDSDYDSDESVTADEIDRRRYLSCMEYQESCRKIAEMEKEAEKAWERDSASWLGAYLRGEVSGYWRDAYVITEDKFIPLFNGRTRAPCDGVVRPDLGDMPDLHKGLSDSDDSDI